MLCVYCMQARQLTGGTPARWHTHVLPAHPHADTREHTHKTSSRSNIHLIHLVVRLTSWIVALVRAMIIGCPAMSLLASVYHVRMKAHMGLDDSPRPTCPCADPAWTRKVLADPKGDHLESHNPQSRCVPCPILTCRKRVHTLSIMSEAPVARVLKEKLRANTSKASNC